MGRKSIYNFKFHLISSWKLIIFFILKNSKFTNKFIKDENSSILFSTHITSDLEKIADYISFISQGKLVFSKNKDDLIYDYGILKTDSKSLSNYDNKYFLKIKEEKYNTDVLIKNKKEFSNRYKDAILEKPSIDQIMVFYERGK